MPHLTTQTARRVLLLLALLAALAGCGPEAGRARGGGPGADPGNYTEDFRPRSKVFVGESQP
ncbi:MAG TPA: hypothetical protein VFZ66_11460 [Herpetosiphonaceae bacterium]